MPIYKQKDGSYLVKVNFTDKSGNHKQIVRKNSETKTRAGALKLEAQLILDYADNASHVIIEKEKKLLEGMTFKMLAEDYMENCRHSQRRSTLSQKEKAYRIYLIPFFGKILINDFTPSLIQRFKNSLDNAKTEKGKPFTTSYKNTILKAFNASLNYAVKYYGYANTAYRRVGTFSDTYTFNEDNEVSYWTYEQFRAFSDTLRKECEEKEKALDPDFIRDWGEYVLFNILFFCGLRKGEAYPLHWTDIKDKGGYYVISVTKSLAQKNGYEITPPKNKSSVRVVPICEELLKILTEHYERYQQVYYFDPKSPDWYICGGISPIIDTTLDNTKNRLAKKLGLPRIRIHDFRHSFVSMLINADVNIKTISKLVGHSTVDQTWNTYGHLYPDKENEAIRTINSLTANYK